MAIGEGVLRSALCDAAVAGIAAVEDLKRRFWPSKNGQSKVLRRILTVLVALAISLQGHMLRDERQQGSCECHRMNADLRFAAIDKAIS